MVRLGLVAPCCQLQQQPLPLLESRLRCARFVYSCLVCVLQLEVATKFKVQAAVTFLCAKHLLTADIYCELSAVLR